MISLDRHRLSRAAATAAILLAVACSRLAPAGDAPAPALAVISDREIEIAAVVNARGFERSRPWAQSGYHAAVWKGGRAAGGALFSTMATDLEVLDALERLGAEPGNNLTLATWQERFNPQHPAPDAHVAGPAVEVFVRRTESGDLLPLAAVFDNPGGQGIELRLGGHRALSTRWRSGCIVCLYSCPGSKIGNARYTVRNFVRSPRRFRVKAGALPIDGRPVRLILRLANPRRIP